MGTPLVHSIRSPSSIELGGVVNLRAVRRRTAGGTIYHVLEAEKRLQRDRSGFNRIRERSWLHGEKRGSHAQAIPDVCRIDRGER
jgi:hypothetical protein